MIKHLLSINQLTREDVTRILFTPNNVTEAVDLKAILPEADWNDLVQSGFDRITEKMVDASGRMGPKEALKWATGADIQVEETLCKAKGDPYCQFVIGGAA